MNTYLTSDTHFNHNNILKYCNRPFSNIQEHDEALILNWNSKISKKDLVYHLGDFAFSDPRGISQIISRLNFKELVFVSGNHDRHLWEGVRIYNDERKAFHDKPVIIYNSYLEKKLDGHSCTLCHYAMRIWNKSHYGNYMLYGHSHGTLPDDPNALSIDVGVDCHNYFPISMQEVRDIMAKKNFKPIDHHGGSHE